MKKWRCTVCGYVHTGDEPPEKCPVCGADKSLFEEIVEEVPETAAVSVTADKWKCSVCSYTLDEFEPPEKCPVCGADKSLFEPLLPEKTDAGNTAPDDLSEDDSENSSSRLYELSVRQILKHHIHPMSVHIPNGVIPVTFIFVLLSTFFNATNFGIAAHYNMIFVVLTLPLVLFSGYTEWKNRYGGHMTNMFLTKIICAAVVSVCALIVVMWWNMDPDIASVASPNRRLFLFLNIVMLVAAIIAGFIGGKLVFKD